MNENEQYSSENPIPEKKIENFNKCRSIAISAHCGQVRKFGDDKGKPYIVHPERVADRFNADKRDHICASDVWLNICASVAWLHDVIENTDIDAEKLIELGVDEEIVKAVKDLTRIEDENYLDFILRARQTLIGCEVKIADIEDNMISLKEGSLKDKYRMALYILKDE